MKDKGKEQKMKKITDFLNMSTDKKELAITLKVLKKFKSCESKEEWLGIFFVAWAKLEQFEEFLEYLVNKKPLKEDTLEYIKRE